MPFLAETQHPKMLNSAEIPRRADDLAVSRDPPPARSLTTFVVKDPFEKLPIELRECVISFLGDRTHFNNLCRASSIIYRQRKTDSLLVCWDKMHKRFGDWELFIASSLIGFLRHHVPTSSALTCKTDFSHCHSFGDYDPLFSSRQYLVFEVDALYTRMMIRLESCKLTLPEYLEEHKTAKEYKIAVHLEPVFQDLGDGKFPNLLPPRTSPWRAMLLYALLSMELIGSLCPGAPCGMGCSSFADAWLHQGVCRAMGRLQKDIHFNRQRHLWKLLFKPSTNIPRGIN